jgi:ABC-type uncharacterized transport system substrate-binding protein
MGVYTGRILKGEKPADLPVQQPTKFEFLINPKTAKAIGLEIPAKLLALADEVIEGAAGVACCDAAMSTLGQSRRDRPRARVDPLPQRPESGRKVGASPIIATDPFLLARREQLVALASYNRVPTIYFLREFVDAGGLISYGPSIASGYRQAGLYAGRILSGANPGALPVMQPTHFLLFLNLKGRRRSD